MGIISGANLSSDGLVYSLDAANFRSYSGSGLTSNALVGGIGATLVNGVGFTSSNGGTFVFDGTNDYMLSSSLGLSANDPKSLFAWIKPILVSTLSGYTRLINYMPDATNRFILALSSWNTPVNTYFIAGTPNNNSAPFIKTSKNYNLNEWKYVGWTYNGSTQNFYVDGILQSSIADTSGSFGFTGISGLIIGARTDSGATFYNGNVGQASIYNRALSAKEVKQNYNATKKRYGL